MSRYKVAMEALQQAVHDLDGISDHKWKVRAQCEAMLHHYDAYYCNTVNDFEVIGVETKLHGDVINLENMEILHDYRLYGKVDKIIKFNERDALGNERFAIIDHKTTTMDIAHRSSTYLRALEIALQPKTYKLLGMQYNLDCQIIWDIVRKPNIKPKLIPVADRAEIEEKGTYLGEAVTGLPKGNRENFELYRIRCIKWLGEDNFRQHIVNIGNEKLAEHNQDIVGIATELERATEDGFWPHNEQACNLYSSPCEYLSICSGKCTEEDPDWERLAFSEERGGPVRLTDTRMKVFLNCRRKYYYQYVLGLKAKTSKEHFDVGIVWGAALDRWYDPEGKFVEEEDVSN